MWQSVSVAAVLGPNGERRCVVNIIDVSNEVQREQVLEQQRKELGCLASKLSEANRELVTTNEALQRKLSELREFNELAIGRELRMIELKQEVNGLFAERGESQRYVVDR